MQHDAFTGGVDPGGLWTKNDIRILICYLLSSVNAPLSGEDISRVLQGRALANYFETADALSALEQLGHIAQQEAGFTITPTGREIASGLDAGLPLAVRDKALEAALLLLAEARSRRENRVERQETSQGVQVTCRIAGGEGVDLMTVSLCVPDQAQAQLVEENFYRDPDVIYKLLLSSLTGDKDFARELFL